MAYTLRIDEEATMFPVRKISSRPYDPYHHYFLFRKEQGMTAFRRIGLLRQIDNKFIICWIDDNDLEVIERVKDGDGFVPILKQLANDFEIIELDNDEYCYGECGHSVDFNKGAEMMYDIIEQLIDRVRYERR